MIIERPAPSICNLVNFLLLRPFKQAGRGELISNLPKPDYISWIDATEKLTEISRWLRRLQVQSLLLTKKTLYIQANTSSEAT